MAVSTPAPSPVSLSQAHAPRWYIRSANLWASRKICVRKWRKIEEHKMLDGLKLSVSNYLIQFDRCAWLKFVECWQENESNRQTSTVDWILMNNSCKWQSVVLAVCLVSLVALLFHFRCLLHVIRLRKAFLLLTLWLRLPSMATMNPTPHASCSFWGS